MATTVQKITLSSSRDIPFNKLVLSQSNVRRVKAGVSIEELAEDIARRTLLQGLNVRPVLDADGGETGMFEVPAGGRRYRALQLLVKQKRLAKTAPVPCVVRDPSVDISAEEDSLAENVHRAPLHPLDQFRAFQALRDRGQSEEDIAAAFFVGVNVVKQRVRLAAVSEKLLDVYSEDGMSLDQLMAFTVTTDHARQEQVWETLQRSYSQEPYQIRRMLTERTVRASDKRALFVGLDAYEKAGGIVMRDLFQRDDGGWLENVALLDSLVAEKLKAEAEKIAAEGWKWLEVNVDFPFGHTHRLRELDGTPTDLTAEEQATIKALRAEYAKLEAEYENADELPDEVDARLGEIETALAAFEDRPVSYDPAEVARAGVFVCIDSEGNLSVDRGYVRPEDEPSATVDIDAGEPPAPAVQRAVITIGGEAPAEEDEDDTVKPLPDRLVSELTAYRTLALRDAVGNDPQVAMTALLHKLCLDTFQHAVSGNCLEASVRQVFFSIQPADLKDSPPAKAVAERHEAWKANLPKDEAQLWDWLAVLDDTARAALLAHASHSASMRSTKRATAIVVPASPSMASSAGSYRPTGSRARSGSTWSNPAGGRRSTTISAA
jgi:ParB family transcriptional regulator, chromosome partitioning protein